MTSLLFDPNATRSWVNTLRHRRPYPPPRQPAPDTPEAVAERALVNAARAVELGYGQQQPGVIQADASFILRAHAMALGEPWPPPKPKPKSNFIGPDGGVLLDETAKMICEANEKRLGLL